MKAVWLTEEQLIDAQWQVNQFNTELLEVEVPVKPFQTILFSKHIYPEYKPLTLHFRRQSIQVYKWELYTPVQICNEWIAKHMQSINH